MRPSDYSEPQRDPIALEALHRGWIDRLCRRSWGLRRDAASSSSNGPSLLARLEDRCMTLLEALVVALDTAPQLLIGAAEYREVVQHLSFTAGWMAGEGLPISDAVILVQTLQESLELEGHDPAAQARFFQGLMVVAGEAYAAALEQRAHARYRDAMEKSQLVCDLHPQLPYLFLLGDPDRHALEDAVGRVMMLAAMRQAPAVVVDVAGLIWPPRTLPEAAEILADHAQAAGVLVTLSGAPPASRKALSSSVHSVHETLAEAVKAAAAATGLELTL